jgi:hypothetical protein
MYLPMRLLEALLLGFDAWFDADFPALEILPL